MPNYDQLFKDKKTWIDGPWKQEPDRMEWTHRGFPCLMVRNTAVTGSWCGYVAVPPDHPAYEKPYDKVDVNVHGGLTYADHCRGHVCHKPKDGEPDTVWWFGFDCAHAFDLMPRMRTLMKAIAKELNQPDLGTDYFPERYRDVAYVKKETEKLADQLKRTTTKKGD
jgi:hypothetical protein